MPEPTVASERSSKTAGLALVSGDGTGGERLSRSGLPALERKGGADLAVQSELIKLGTLKQEAGAYAEAEALFRRALDIGERGRDRARAGRSPR